MKSTSKWYLLAPAVAALLILGPLSMQSGTPAAATAPTPASQPEATETGRTRPIVAPKSPDLLQMSSALVGVLLLGVGGLFVLRRLRNGPTPNHGGALIIRRQTLRLSARQAVHAIEFDDRLLLIGEHERGLSLLDNGRLPERASDEAEVLARSAAAVAAIDDDGAVPKNLVIPRPDRPPALPTKRPQVAVTRDNTPLGNFRALLQQVGRA